MTRVLYDTNIILDVLLKREPHLLASARALDAAATGRVEGHLAGHAVTTIAYLLQRQLGLEKSPGVLIDLLSTLKVAAVTDAVIRQALARGFADFEDAVTCEAASQAGCSIIVTRNTDDFARSPIPAILPDLFRPA